MRGEISPSIAYWDELVEGQDVEHLWHRPVARGRWPDDYCNTSALPINPAASQPFWGGDSFANLMGEAQSVIDALQPIPAIWLDGTEVELTVGLGEPKKVCFRGRYFPRVFFNSDTALTTSDERMHAVPRYGQLALDESAAKRAKEGLFLYDNLTALTAAELEEALGIAGFDAAGATEFQVEISVFYDWKSEQPETNGHVRITGVPACATAEPSCTGTLGREATLECLHWPPSARGQTNCGDPIPSK